MGGMSILTASNLSKFFGADEIFSGISVSIPAAARIAMVGPNGAGKTTLLRVLIGLDAPTDGAISLAKGTRTGYLPQNPELDGEQTVYQEMLAVFDHLRRLEHELSHLEHHLTDELLERYGRLQTEFEAAGGYTYEMQIEQVLRGLGFPRDLHDRSLSQLSGGQKTRALLARLLLEKPDLLVLDEPTNHLDIDAIEWLEGFLRNYEGAVLMVSHDRYFMDSCATVIWELDWGEIELYRGNFSHYIQQREERHERRLKDYEAQQEFIAKEEDYIRKNIAGQNTAQAKGRRKRLERMMDSDWLRRKPPKKRSFHIHLRAEVRTGDHVLRTKNLNVGYDTPLFTSPDLLLLRGEVAAIIGPNGAGKSTFLKTILGELPALRGEAVWGSQVDIGYFAQAHERLNPTNTVFDELLTVKNLPISEARNYLGGYLFTGDDVFRPVSTLSGGERGRLALAKLALDGANVLLLDEPTNHLDIQSQELLQDVLANFGGTILLVSHDRYLIDALATQIWHITPGKMTLFTGRYAEYLATLQPPSEAKKTTPPSKKSNTENTRKNGMTSYQRQKRLEELESEIADLEAVIAALWTQLEDLSAAGNAAEVAKLGETYNQKEAELNQALEEWAALAD